MLLISKAKNPRRVLSILLFCYACKADPLLALQGVEQKKPMSDTDIVALLESQCHCTVISLEKNTEHTKYTLRTIKRSGQINVYEINPHQIDASGSTTFSELNKGLNKGLNTINQ